MGAYSTIFAATLLLAGLVFIVKQRWVHIVIMVLIDLWLVANLLYYNANAILLDWQAITTISELRGFESAILSYIHWQHIIIPLLTVATASFLIGVPQNESRQWKSWLCTLSICVGLYSIGYICDKLFYQEDTDQWSIKAPEQRFLSSHSPLGHLAKVASESIEETFLRHQSQHPLTTEEQQMLSLLIGDSVPQNEPKGHLVYILVESWESWTLNAKDSDGNPVCPNILQFMSERPVLFCDKVLSQQQYGRSGDGQLITQTGMLPLIHGVACMQFGENRYPNLAHFYPNSVVLNPYRGVWNQHTTTYSYGFKHLREPARPMRHSNDSVIMTWAREELDTATVPTCMLALTYNTHAPFNSVKEHREFDDSYTTIEQKYLNTVHYMDRQVGRFLQWADTAQTMQDATIVITADHNHFPVSDNRGLCPLIVSGPTIEQNIHIHKAYQMDIFPTVLHAIDQTNYWWHGFGIDLLDSTSRRQLTPNQCLYLSDKLIRRNYFKIE